MTALFYYKTKILKLNKVKKYMFLILLMIIYCRVNAQQRDLNFYLDQAKTNSPLINKSKNENKVVTLDLQQIRSILAKPEINFESGIIVCSDYFT